MKQLLISTVLALIAVTAHATESSIDLKKQIAWGAFSFGAASVADATTLLTQQGIKSCPSGFEKLREYAAPDGDAWYLHFVIRCITPATPSSTAPAAPK